MRMLDASGRILVTLVPTPLDMGWFGDGSDLAVTLDGAVTPGFCSKSGNVYTLTRSIFCTNLTLNAGITLKTAGFKVFCTGTLSILNTGILSNNGVDAVGQTAGTALAQAELGGGTAGGAGGNAGAVGANAVTNSNPNPGTGSGQCVGGAGGSGVSGGGAAGANSIQRPIRYLTTQLLAGASIQTGGSGGGGGAGGTSGVGGGGGGGAGVVMVFANAINVDTVGPIGGLISANGGKGANGGVTGGGTNSGGGGGGGGGLVYLAYSSLVGASRIQALGGTPGSVGTGGASGNSGLAGGIGVILRFNFQSRAWEF